MAREMNEDAVREFLTAGTRTAKLATTMRDGSPHVIPVWFVLGGRRARVQHPRPHGQGPQPES